MRRREFIAGLGGAAAWPLVARAQRSNKIYRIGFIANDPAIPAQPAGRAFLDGLDKSGFVEGKNVIIERRFAEGRPERYGDLAGELVNLRVDVIVSSSNEATAAVKRATNTIPVVMLNVDDPVGLGIISSLSHPGGNITGVVQDDSPELTTKRLQLLKDAVPQATKVAVLMNPDIPYAHAQWEKLQRAARVLNLVVWPTVARHVNEIETAFADFERHRPDALFVASSGLNFSNRKLIMELALKNRLPATSAFRESTEAGGLLSYSSNRVERYRLAAIYYLHARTGRRAPFQSLVFFAQALKLVFGILVGHGYTSPSAPLLSLDRGTGFQFADPVLVVAVPTIDATTNFPLR
jgi:putative ABC transport system substrate-binding protein